MGRALSVRDEHQMDRLLDDRVDRELDECAIVDERGVERSEGVVLELRDFAEVALNARRSGLDRAREAAHSNTIAEPCLRRKILGERSVHKNNGVPAVLAEVEP